MKQIRYYSTEITFKDIPGEITLDIFISGCPNNCVGCHSAILKSDIGKKLDESALESIINKYKNGIDCICFMGDSNDRNNILKLVKFLKKNYNNYKIGWYSGFNELPPNWTESDISNFDYIKIGEYKEEFGPLTSKATNQKFYKIEKTEDKIELTDCTKLFYDY